MGNREILLQKIEAQEKEWENKLKDLQTKSQGFATPDRLRFEEQIASINRKLKTIEQQTSLIKDDSKAWTDLGESIIKCWDEIVKNIDVNISRLAK